MTKPASDSKPSATSSDMRIELAYHVGTQTADLPEGVIPIFIRNGDHPVLQTPEKAFYSALQNSAGSPPLADMLHSIDPKRGADHMFG